MPSIDIRLHTRADMRIDAVGIFKIFKICVRKTNENEKYPYESTQTQKYLLPLRIVNS